MSNNFSTCLSGADSSVYKNTLRLDNSVSGGPDNSKVLVVGTTSDYVELIRKAKPGRAVFLTSEIDRNLAIEPKPDPDEEIICDLDDSISLIFEKIKNHTCKWDIKFSGIACYDCDSMELAAALANKLCLSYPSSESIKLCRNKFSTKKIWEKNNISCPRNRLVQSTDDVISFFEDLDGRCVIKPLSGSGSELVFLCVRKKDCSRNTKLILDGLKQKSNNRLYTDTNLFVAEEFISGEEFSCDFTIMGNYVEILRMTKKIKFSKSPFGTINGYMIQDWQYNHLFMKKLVNVLQQGATALGFYKAICMVDFIVKNDEIFLIEMTPRPGGDCIPFLLKNSTGFDVLSFNLDFARNNFNASENICKNNQAKQIGLRLHADNSGIISHINTKRLAEDQRVVEINIIRQTGHRISMPPMDYESWYLGYIIFKPYGGVSDELQCHELRKLLDVEIVNENN